MGIDKYIKRLNAIFLSNKKRKGNLDDDAPEVAEPTPEAKTASAFEMSGSSTSMIRSLIGATEMDEDYFFPADLLGGTCPRIPGEEEEIVWNAAAECCDSERVHVVWQAVGNRIWYLAIRSGDLASRPNSWCPLSSLLPTAKDIEKLPLCYTYFGEEIAILMVITAEELNVFRGTTPVVRAKAERTGRELGVTTVINLDPYRISQLTPVPWYSVSLFENRARRILATVSVFVSLLVIGVSFAVWLFTSMSMIASRHELAETLQRTHMKSIQVLRQVENVRSSPLRDQVEKFLSVNDGLLGLNGFLDVYEIKDKVTRWRASVPPSATADRITAMGAKNIGTTEQGAIIGNDAEIEYEATKERR